MTNPIEARNMVNPDFSSSIRKAGTHLLSKMDELGRDKAVNHQISEPLEGKSGFQLLSIICGRDPQALIDIVDLSGNIRCC
jgi:hypothetical protein